MCSHFRALFLAMDISELQWHVKQEKQELIKAEEKLDYASTINKGGFQSYTLHTLKSRAGTTGQSNGKT